MRILFLPSAAKDIVWMRHYYSHIFPEWKINFVKKYNRAREALKENPLIGVKDGDFRRYIIPNSPFSITYKFEDEVIFIYHVYDWRRNPAVR